MQQPLPHGVEISGSLTPQFTDILSADALLFVATLHRQFNSTREQLLRQRDERQAELDTGTMPNFLEETRSIRQDNWHVATTPLDLAKRRVEITGPTDRKMMINALNSGASVFMADLEDSLSPTWTNVVQGQINLRDAVRRSIEFQNPDGRQYQLNETTATLLVRPRGWHLTEKHMQVDGASVSASLFDFGLYIFHNITELGKRGSGPYFYLAKLESHHEARLWNDVFNAAQDLLGVPRGTVRATVLVETILAAFEMDEILYELREHAAGLNAGRWDYMFSAIKKFRNRQDMMLPERGQITMTVPFLRAYTELLVKTCHRRGAHAIGGMAAFIPTRRDPKVNETAMQKVREDKEREAGDGFDGTWVAHPDLVSVAMEMFDRVLGNEPHQKQRLREEVNVTASELIDFKVPGGSITEAGLRNNISVGLQYINSWLNGNGAAAIFNLMEDAATAEISRAQLWQWIRYGATLDDGSPVTVERYRQLRGEELEKLGGTAAERYADAAMLMDRLCLERKFVEFLTLPAYAYLE